MISDIMKVKFLQLGKVKLSYKLFTTAYSSLTVYDNHIRNDFQCVVCALVDGQKLQRAGGLGFTAVAGRRKHPVVVSGGGGCTGSA